MIDIGKGDIDPPLLCSFKLRHIEVSLYLSMFILMSARMFDVVLKH